MIDLDTDDQTEAPTGSDPVQCRGTTKTGLPCASPIVSEQTGYCVSHDPERVLEVESWRILGGKGTSREAQIERKLLHSGDLGAVAGALVQTIAELRQMELTPAVANSIASVSRSYLATREAALAERRMARVLEILEEKLGGVVDIEDWSGDDE